MDCCASVAEYDVELFDDTWSWIGNIKGLRFDHEQCFTLREQASDLLGDIDIEIVRWMIGSVIVVIGSNDLNVRTFKMHDSSVRLHRCFCFSYVSHTLSEEL